MKVIKVDIKTELIDVEGGNELIHFYNIDNEEFNIEEMDWSKQHEFIAKPITYQIRRYHNPISEDIQNYAINITKTGLLNTLLVIGNDMILEIKNKSFKEGYWLCKKELKVMSFWNKLKLLFLGE